MVQFLQLEAMLLMAGDWVRDHGRVLKIIKF